MVSFSPITRHERQIPRGGKAEGRMPFRRGRVLPVRCAGLPHCGITAKNGLFFGGGINCLCSASCAPCKSDSSGLFLDAHSASVRTGLPSPPAPRGRMVGRGVPPSRLPANRTIHSPASSGGCGAYSLFTCTPLSFRAGSVAVRTTGARGKGIAAG